jgi:hypothetical protein
MRLPCDATITRLRELVGLFKAFGEALVLLLVVIVLKIVVELIGVQVWLEATIRPFRFFRLDFSGQHLDRPVIHSPIGQVIHNAFRIQHECNRSSVYPVRNCLDG